MINWDELDLKNRASGQIKIKCPVCIDRRSNKSDRSLSVNIDKGVAKCHYCEEVSIRDFKNNEKEYKLPDQQWRNYTGLSDNLVKWFKTRGISQSTLIDCRITEEKYFQPALKKEVNNVVFNYFEGDKLVNKKYRSGDKKFTQSSGTKNIFYGINDIVGSDEVFLVEGEIDKLSLWEIGIKNCISVPNGANDNDDVWINCERYFEFTKKFFIATDNDDKGNMVAEKIAQRLGRWRCERVQFKNKDANDDLKESPLVLEESLKNTKRYPVSGTYTTKDLRDDILELYHKGIPETISPKSNYFKGMTDVFTLMKGHLVTVTGIPSHGKSSFTDWYVINLIADYDMKGSWFSPEHSPMALHKSRFISLFFGRPFFKSIEGYDRVTEQEILEYEKWANEKIYLTSPEKGESPTWQWLIDKFKEQMFCYGIDIFVVDAFNKVHLGSGNKKDMIDQVLTELTNFCQINNVIIFLIAHPTKMKKLDNGDYEIPNLYDVSGSADFRNQTHDGFCIYRFFDSDNSEGHTMFQNLKTKFNFQGDIGKDIRFKYHKPSGRYYSYSLPYLGGKLIEEIPEPNLFQSENETTDCPF